MKTTETFYLSDEHRKNVEASLEIAQKQSQMSLEEFTKQVNDLASQSQRLEPSDKNSTEPYVPSKNNSLEIA
jgi:hypothetical protein